MNLEQIKAFTDSRLDQQWAAAGDWLRGVASRAPSHLFRLAHVLDKKDLTQVRAMDDHTLLVVTLLAGTCLSELLSRRMAEKLEANDEV